MIWLLKNSPPPAAWRSSSTGWFDWPRPDESDEELAGDESDDEESRLRVSGSLFVSSVASLDARDSMFSADTALSKVSVVDAWSFWLTALTSGAGIERPDETDEAGEDEDSSVDVEGEDEAEEDDGSIKFMLGSMRTY